MANEIDKYLAGEVVFTPAVVGYLVDGGMVLLGVRKKVSHGLGENLIAGIGGKVGDAEEIKNETVSEAMDREAEEEINVKITEKKEMGRVRFIFSHKPPNSKWNQDVTIFSVTKWEGEPTETESIKPLWFKKEEVPFEKMGLITKTCW